MLHCATCTRRGTHTTLPRQRSDNPMLEHNSLVMQAHLPRLLSSSPSSVGELCWRPCLRSSSDGIRLCSLHARRRRS